MFDRRRFLGVLGAAAMGAGVWSQSVTHRLYQRLLERAARTHDLNNDGAWSNGGNRWALESLISETGVSDETANRVWHSLREIEALPDSRFCGAVFPLESQRTVLKRNLELIDNRLIETQRTSWRHIGSNTRNNSHGLREVVLKFLSPFARGASGSAAFVHLGTRWPLVPRQVSAPSSQIDSCGVDEMLVLDASHDQRNVVDLKINPSLLRFAGPANAERLNYNEGLRLVRREHGELGSPGWYREVFIKGDERISSHLASGMSPGYRPGTIRSMSREGIFEPGSYNSRGWLNVNYIFIAVLRDYAVTNPRVTTMFAAIDRQTNALHQLSFADFYLKGLLAQNHCIASSMAVLAFGE